MCLLGCFAILAPIAVKEDYMTQASHANILLPGHAVFPSHWKGGKDGMMNQ